MWKENQLGILKIMYFTENLSRVLWVLERAWLGLCLSMRIHLKSCFILRIKVVKTLLNGSREAKVAA